MRIIDYYNYIAAAAFTLMGVAAVIIAIFGKKDKFMEKEISDKLAFIGLLMITAVAAFLRLYKLGAIPYGLQQDEASLGYDAFCLATKGIDRNGYAYPIYPITWGCGGGSPLMIYLNVISIKLFGTGVVKLRMLPAVCGIATVFLFFFALKKSFGNKMSLLGTAFLALCPWHVILSRWSLDSNIMPFVMLIPMLLFMKAHKSGKTGTFCLSAALYGLCMYSYGSANIVIPLHLLLICTYCIIDRSLKWKQLFLSAIAFIVVCLPLGVFYAVNYLGLPEIITDVVCFNKFTASRTGEVFLSGNQALLPQITSNLKVLIKVMTIGDSSDMVCHYIPGFSTLFKFTFPLTGIGILLGIIGLFDKKKDRGEKCSDALWLSMLVSCVALGIVISTDISRMVMIFLPLMFFFVKGTEFVCVNIRKGGLVIGVATLIAAVMFIKSYFTDFNNISSYIFMPEYGEAMAKAYEIAGDDRPIYSTYKDLSAPFALALYYTNYDPDKFYTSVIYKDPDAEFRIARSYGNFTFDYLPEDLENGGFEDTVFVAEKGEFEDLDITSDFKIADAGKYVVFYK